MFENKEFGRGANAVCLAFFKDSLEIKVLVWLKAGVYREQFLDEVGDAIYVYTDAGVAVRSLQQFIEDLLNYDDRVLRWATLPTMTKGFKLS